jgi:hypothetical protein
MWNWIHGWWVTYQIWRHDRETYRFLVSYKHNPDDFVDAPRPT